jgi:hypothetical protein
MIEELPSVSLPPPEPEPARAPRPLVREEDDLDERSEPPDGEASGLVVGSEPRGPFVHEDATSDVDSTASPNDDEGARSEPTLDGPLTLGELEVEPSNLELEAEARPAMSAPAAREPEPSVELEVVDEPGRAGVGREAAPETQGGSNRPVDTAATSDGAEADDEHGEAPEAEPETKRRWSLFRRGGNR